MVVVFQIAAGIVIAVLVLFLAYALLLNWAAAEPERRQSKTRALQIKEEERRLKQEQRAYYSQNPLERLKWWWSQILKPFFIWLTLLFLVSFLLIGFISLGEENLLPSFIQRYW